METQKPIAGTWTLTAPDGRQWQADSPMRCVSVEQRDRVPADVALARVLAAASEPDFADRHVKLGEQFGAKNVDELVDALFADAAKSERRAIMFGDLMHHQILAMRAAVVDAHLRGHEHGMAWVENTLCGPGHLPDIDAARAEGGAQCMFDREVAEQVAFRAAHPAP